MMNIFSTNTIKIVQKGMSKYLGSMKRSKKRSKCKK